MFSVTLHRHGQPVATFPAYASWHVAAATALELAGAIRPGEGYAVHLESETGGEPLVIPVNEDTAVAYADYIKQAHDIATAVA